MHGAPRAARRSPRLGRGKLNATSILLEPLNAEECGQLVTNLLADDSVDPVVRERIATAAEGHPLYAEEITGLLVDEGRLVLKEGRWTPTGDLADLPVPPTISALLAARLDKLPASERRLIEVASVMGQVFYLAAVRELSSEVSDATDGIAALVRKQIIRPERSDLSATDALGFRHLLIRDEAYASIPKATRAELHERFAAWLDETAGSLGERDEIVGYHLEQAYRYRAELGPLDDGTRALAYRAAERLAASGHNAYARRDLSATVNLLARATELLSPGDPLRIELLADLGLALSRADLPRADDVLAEAIDGARMLGDPRLEALAGVRRLFVRMMRDADAVQQASLEEAERYAELFDGWSDDLGVAEALTLVGTDPLLGRTLRRGRGSARARDRACAPGREPIAGGRERPIADVGDLPRTRARRRWSSVDSRRWASVRTGIGKWRWPLQRSSGSSRRCSAGSSQRGSRSPVRRRLLESSATSSR